MTIVKDDLRILPVEPIDALDQALEVAHVFAQIFQREAQRAMDGHKHEVPRSIAQLRACLDQIDALLRGKQ